MNINSKPHYYCDWRLTKSSIKSSFNTKDHWNECYKFDNSYLIQLFLFINVIDSIWYIIREFGRQTLKLLPSAFYDNNHLEE